MATFLAATAGSATVDRPPPGHTGAFGEPSCQACHTDAAVNHGDGSLVIRGLPDCFSPGTRYTVSVILRQDGMGAAGFQLAARFQHGAQAGSLRPVEQDEHRIGITDSLEVQYAHHTYPGSRPADGVARWSLHWHAPDARAAVAFNAAAVAGDNDISPLGDFVYTATRVTCAP